MKVIAILNIDPDVVLDSVYNYTLEEAIESEIEVYTEGIIEASVIAPDAVKPNDADLGELIRTKLND